MDLQPCHTLPTHGRTFSPGSVAEFASQLGLVHFNLVLELRKFLLLLGAQWRLLLGVLLGIFLLLSAAWVL